MKKYIFGLVAAVALCASVNTAKAEVEVTGGADLVSASVWRGGLCAGPSIQPAATLSAAGFSLTGWCSQSLYESDARELDFTLGYSIGGFTVAATNYWWTGVATIDYIDGDYPYFEGGTHQTEITLAYEFGENFPLAISINTMIDGDFDMNADGDQMYSTYVDVSYPFSISSVDCSATVGITPWEGVYSGVDSDGELKGFNVATVGLNFSKNIVETDKFVLPMFVDVSFSPAMEQAYLVAGLSFGF